ncbi:MAG: hypothetical protein HYV27_15255 [Candidatus Hydrogenedentes bacterium]|nr:hypothetical protein [Candidatus Hydrogenedentota bacterium]
MKIKIVRVAAGGKSEILSECKTDNAARAAAITAAREYPDDQIFAQWYRASDGQIGYLNTDGNSPVGKAW